jgi:hypothetical protein
MRSINPRLFPLADFDLSDFAIENGHEKPKQHNIRNSKIPISTHPF